jgi:hypothetical protein
MACVSARKPLPAVCYQLDPTVGEVVGEYLLPWDAFVGIVDIGGLSHHSALKSVLLSEPVEQTLLLVGTTSTASPPLQLSTLAFCTLQWGVSGSSALACRAQVLRNALLYDALWVPATTRVIVAGKYATYSLIAATDATGNPVWAKVFSASVLRTMRIVGMGTAPTFVGCFVAGVGVSAYTDAAVCIVGGWFHSELGNMLSVMSIVPRDFMIRNTANLVLAMVVDIVTLDSILVGCMAWGGGGSGVTGLTTVNSAYLIRFNTLFQSTVYGVRFVSLTASERSMANAVVSIGTFLYVLCEVTSNEDNWSELVVLKVVASSGEIASQVRVVGPESITCSKMVYSADTGKLTLACATQPARGESDSIVFTTDLDLTCKSLKVGYTKVITPTLQAVPFVLKASILSVTQTATTIETTQSKFNASSNGATLRSQSASPSRSPTAVPSTLPSRSPTHLRPSSQPSSQPSAHPSRQPTSCPTAAPSVSPAPTAVPSTATPTSTHRPSGQPSSQPSAGPTGQPVSAPSGQPSAPPSGQPTGQPVGEPTAQPSRQPLSQPTGHPSSLPSGQPSSSPTKQPTIPKQKVNDDDDDNDSSAGSNNDSSSYVIPVACSLAGAAVALLGLGLYYYRRRALADYLWGRGEKDGSSSSSSRKKNKKLVQVQVHPSSTGTSLTHETDGWTPVLDQRGPGNGSPASSGLGADPTLAPVLGVPAVPYTPTSLSNAVNLSAASSSTVSENVDDDNDNDDDNEKDEVKEEESSDVSVSSESDYLSGSEDNHNSKCSDSSSSSSSSSTSDPGIGRGARRENVDSSEERYQYGSESEDSLDESFNSGFSKESAPNKTKFSNISNHEYY